MVPTEFMATAVAVLTDAFPQLLYFVNEFLTRHLVKISIHDVAPAEDCLGFSGLVSSPTDRLAAQR
jgi:hypothetical protein